MRSVSTTVAKGGRIVIPAEFRRELGLSEGDVVAVRLVDREVRIRTRADAIKEAQAIVRRHVKRGRSLTHELRNERRREAASE
jgi:AbrB family looped-hinge helix DNA binding protein